MVASGCGGVRPLGRAPCSRPRPRCADPAVPEWAQGRGLPTPSYREIARTGPHHDPEFPRRGRVAGIDARRGMALQAPPPSRPAAAAIAVARGVEAAG